MVYVSSRGWQSAHDPFNNEINGRLLSIIPFRRGGACPFFRLSNDRQHNQIMFFNSFLSSLTTKTGESNKIKWKIGRKGGSRNSLFFSSSRRTQKKGDTLGNCLIINYGRRYEAERCFFISTGAQDELVSCAGDVNIAFDIKVPEGIYQRNVNR